MLQAVSRDELLKISFELDQALYNHLQWYKNLIRTLTCRLACDKHDVDPKAYRGCRLGQWYYSKTVAVLKDHSGFVALGEAHREMHQFAALLLLASNANQIILQSDYDHFSNSLERLQLEIHGLKNEVDAMLSNRDPLTMTINRNSMLPVLREQQELNKRESQSCCISMVDIDFFKKVNDEHGHLVGDKVLIALAHYLMENLRPYDKVFRFGGEEFLICIPNTNLLQANEMVDRLRAGIDAMAFDVGLPNPVKVTVSCGVAVLDANTLLNNPSVMQIKQCI